MATFNNNETYARNLFLSVQFHDAKCFCMQCRTQKLTDIANANQDFNQLRHQVLNVIPNERQARSDAVFEITKRQILFGKLYKEKCLEGTGYNLNGYCLNVGQKRNHFIYLTARGTVNIRRNSTVIVFW